MMLLRACGQTSRSFATSCRRQTVLSRWRLAGTPGTERRRSSASVLLMVRLLRLTLVILISILVVWMLAAGWCGLMRRYGGFVLVLLAGLALNWAWMIWGLGAKPLERPVFMAQAAATGYAVCAFLAGWLAGRITRELRANRPD